MTVSIINKTQAPFVSYDSGLAFKPGVVRTFDSMNDLVKHKDISSALSAGTLELVGAVGATVFAIDVRGDFGSVDTDVWRRKPVTAVTSIPDGVASVTEDAILLPAGVWAFTIQAAGDGQLRITDAATSTALMTSTEQSKVMSLHGYITLPDKRYISIEAYHTSDDIEAPPSEDSDADGTKYVFMAAKFVCVDQ